MKDLFEDEDDRGVRPRLHVPMNGPELLEEEIVRVMKHLKKGKSSGHGEITIEMILASGNFGIRKIVELVNRIYNRGYIPKEMYRSIFIAIGYLRNQMQWSAVDTQPLA